MTRAKGQKRRVEGIGWECSTTKPKLTQAHSEMGGSRGGALPHGFAGFLEQIFVIPGLSSRAGLRRLAPGGRPGESLQGAYANYLPLPRVCVLAQLCGKTPGTHSPVQVHWLRTPSLSLSWECTLFLGCLY